MTATVRIMSYISSQNLFFYPYYHAHNTANAKFVEYKIPGCRLTALDCSLRPLCSLAAHLLAT